MNFEFVPVIIGAIIGALGVAVFWVRSTIKKELRNDYDERIGPF